MKILLYILLILLFFSCRENPPQPIVTPKNCPLPALFTDPNTKFEGTHYAIKLSPDGTKLFFTEDKILDLTTLNVSQFDIKSLLPKNIQYGGLGPVIHWCPYDNTKFVIEPHWGVDTVGDGKKFPGGFHIAICSIDGTYFKDITPKVFNAIGSRSPISIDAWLPTSTLGNDWFLINYQLKEFGEGDYSLYNPATQELQDQEYKGLSAYTKDWVCKYYVKYDSAHILRYYINDNELVFKDIKYASPKHGCFRPDGKHFAVSANVFNKTKLYDSTSRL